MEGLADQGVDCGCFSIGTVIRIVPPSALPRDAADLVSALSRDDADARDRIVAILRKVPARRARIPATNNHFRTLRTPDGGAAAFPVSIDP